MIALAGDFLFEEQMVIFLVPFVPVGFILGVRYIVAKIRKRPGHWSGGSEGFSTRALSSIALLSPLTSYCTLPRHYKSADAIEDIDSFVKTLEDVHPNLYDLVSREEFADSVGNVKRRISGSVGEHELFINIARLGSLVRDAHTGNGYSYFLAKGEFPPPEDLPVQDQSGQRQNLRRGELFVQGRHPSRVRK